MKSNKSENPTLNELIGSNKVGDYMTRNILVGKENFTVKHVARLFNELKIHHLPIVNKIGDIEGIITANDLLRVCSRVMEGRGGSESSELNDFIVDYMTPNPTVCSPSDSIENAILLFGQGRFHALPVVEDGELVGIFTANDLIAFLYSTLKGDEDK